MLEEQREGPARPSSEIHNNLGYRQDSSSKKEG